MRKRKIPLRKCIACNENKNKKDLIRVVKNKDNEIFVDKTGKLNGRGAYLCLDRSCISLCKKQNALSKTFNIKIPEEIYTELDNLVSSD